MKKIYTLLLAATAASLTANAQQLPNVGFEGSWSDCIPWTSNNNTSKQGENPDGWKISNVGGMGATTVGTKVEGNNSATGIQLNQPEVGFGSLKSNVPAYITLGTPWSTSKASIVPAKITNSDGGTFGGMDFSGRPDALSLYYKRSRGTNKPDEKSSVIAYSWKGSWSQESVPGDITLGTSPKTATMVDRDRCVLGYDMTGTQGGTVTNNGGVLISKLEEYITTNQDEWTNAIYEFNYLTNDAPEKINVIISAGDYFAGAAAVGKDNKLIIDDVKFIYYSRLNSISVNGTAIDGFDPNKYDYKVDATLPAATEISYSIKSISGNATATVTLDETNHTATITVTNPQGADIDGESTHTYTLQFNAPTEPVVREGKLFKGTLTVSLGEDEPYIDPEAEVYIIEKEWPNATLCLYNFALGADLQVGDIIVDVTLAGIDGGVSLNGSVEGMELLSGAIIADVEVKGTEIGGNLVADIPVNWLMDGTKDSAYPIDVKFNGYGEASLTSINSIEADNANAPVEYYNLQGMRVNASNLGNGIYIRRQGNETTKVIIRK